tara:strand:- start:10 stop:747 length:738 start_codon:yes stop_codon:yes gene_type:complete
MYQKELSNIFNKQGDDHEGYRWNWRYTAEKTSNQNIVYSIGDSWLSFTNDYYRKVFFNNFKEHMLIDRSISGMSNSLMIQTIEKDMALLQTFDRPITFIVSFSEVGRSINDLIGISPSEYRTTHEYFGEILREQYNQICDILKDFTHYVTTGFVTNNFNTNKSIIDFCKPKLPKPNNAFTVYSNGIFEYLKDRKQIFEFDFASDVEKSLELKTYIESCEYTDDSLHPDQYKPYELFLDHVMANKK